jgi:hypothetical protein
MWLSRKLVISQTFTLAAMLAHNLGRDLQMSAEDHTRSDTTKCAVRWASKTLHSLHHIVPRRSPHATRRQTETDHERRPRVCDRVQRYLRAVHAA